MHRRSTFSAVLALLLITAGCTTASRTAYREVPGAARLEAGFTDEEIRFLADNCPAGVPAKDNDFPHGRTEFVAREGYALEHSCGDRIALWVCERVTQEELSSGATRRNRFAPDSKLAAECRSELADYRRSGFDRGHLAPAGNQMASQRLKDETFFLSNMAPQVGNGFNRNIWAKLEEEARSWVDDRHVDEAWIITGPLFWDPEEEDPDTADGWIPYRTIGPNAVAVPTHFYKIVAAQEDGDWKTVGFVLENERHSQRAGPFDPFIRSVDWIEERTGLDFLPDLGPAALDLEANPGEPFD